MLDNDDSVVQEGDSTIPMLETLDGELNPAFTIPANPWATGSWELGDTVFPVFKDKKIGRVVGPALPPSVVKKENQLLMTIKMRLMYDVGDGKKQRVEDSLYKLMLGLLDGPLEKEVGRVLGTEGQQPIRCSYLIAGEQTVSVAVYTTPAKRTIRVFANMYDAYRWRDEVAEEMWSVFYTDNPPVDEDGEVRIGDEYFKRQGKFPVAAETFTIREMVIEDSL